MNDSILNSFCFVCGLHLHQCNVYNIKLHHYVEDIKGFYPYIDELVSDVFKFKEEDLKEARRRYKALRPELKTMVSVHIRYASDYFPIKHQSQGTRSKEAFTCFFNYILMYLVVLRASKCAWPQKSPRDPWLLTIIKSSRNNTRPEQYIRE